MLSKREKVLIAVLGSILLHLFILLLFGLGLHFRRPVVLAQASNKPIELQIQPKEDEPPVVEPTMPLAPPPPPPMVENKETGATPPPDPAFEANANSAAASEQAAKGSAPVPTQDGRKIPDFTFKDQQAILGDKPAETASAGAQSSAPAQPPPKEQPQPPLPPSTPEPTPSPPPPPRKKDRPSPRSTPAPTPEPLIERDEFAMLGPTPTPHPEPTDEDEHFDPTSRQPRTEPPRPTPALRHPLVQQPPGRPASPGYQPMTQKAAMSGVISNKGPSSVAALGTPMGRYQKAISDAVGSRWNYYIDQRMDTASFGTVRIHFVIDKSGAVLRPTVVTHSGNSTLENSSLQAVMDATIPPMPPEVAAIINSNQMEVDFSFNLMDM